MDYVQVWVGVEERNRGAMLLRPIQEDFLELVGAGEEGTPEGSLELELSSPPTPVSPAVLSSG